MPGTRDSSAAAPALSGQTNTKLTPPSTVPNFLDLALSQLHRDGPLHQFHGDNQVPLPAEPSHRSLRPGERAFHHPHSGAWHEIGCRSQQLPARYQHPERLHLAPRNGKRTPTDPQQAHHAAGDANVAETLRPAAGTYEEITREQRDPDLLLPVAAPTADDPFREENTPGFQEEMIADQIFATAAGVNRIPIVLCLEQRRILPQDATLNGGPAVLGNLSRSHRQIHARKDDASHHPPQSFLGIQETTVPHRKS